MREKHATLQYLEYNTERTQITLPEYGRAIHRMVEYCTQLADKEERNKCARSIIAIMGNLFPQLRDVEDYRHKLWDHLFIMSGFQLDVDSPYPTPSPEQFLEKPEKIEYPKGEIKYGHYGRVTQKLIDKAISLENPEHTKQMSINLFYLMKRSYCAWNRDHVENDVILQHLNKLSNGKITLTKEDLPVQERHFKSNTPSNQSNPTNNRRRKWNNNQNQNRNKKRRPSQ